MVKNLSKLVVAADCRDTNVYLIHVICRDQRHGMEMVDYKLHAHLNLGSTKMAVRMVVLRQVIPLSWHSSYDYTFEAFGILNLLPWCNKQPMYSCSGKTTFSKPWHRTQQMFV